MTRLVKLIQNISILVWKLSEAIDKEYFPVENLYGIGTVYWTDTIIRIYHFHRTWFDSAWLCDCEIVHVGRDGDPYCIVNDFPIVVGYEHDIIVLDGVNVVALNVGRVLREMGLESTLARIFNRVRNHVGHSPYRRFVMVDEEFMRELEKLLLELYFRLEGIVNVLC